VSMQHHLSAGALWDEVNPRVLDHGLQQVLCLSTARVPLLHSACFAGHFGVLRLLIDAMRSAGKLEEALLEELEGWTLPMVVLLGQSARGNEFFMQDFLNALGEDTLKRWVEKAGHLVLPLLFYRNGIRPLDLLLRQASWPLAVQLFVRSGGGFPHDVAPPKMKLLGILLASTGSTHAFLAACHQGGDGLVPGSHSFAALFLGALEPGITPADALVVLDALITHGMKPNSLCTPSGGLYPLHAAARHDRHWIVRGLLARKAEPKLRDGRQRTALELAREAQSPDSVAVLQTATKLGWRPPAWDDVVAAAQADF